MSTSDDETIANQSRDGPLDETSLTSTLGLSEDEAEPALKNTEARTRRIACSRSISSKLYAL